MQLKIKTFGVTRDILGNREVVFELNESKGSKVADLRAELNRRHPELIALKSLFVAVNQKYAEDESVLIETDEIALIPPVAGG